MAPWMLLYFGFVVSVFVALTRCGDVIELSGPFGVVQSPLFPDAYPDNLNITWEIHVRPGFAVSFYFVEFSLEDSYDEELGPCIYDYLKVTDGGRELYKFCGDFVGYPFDAPVLRKEYITKTNNVLIQFVSDYSNDVQGLIGFQMHYTEQDIDECAGMKKQIIEIFDDWDLFVYCNHHCVNVPGSYACTCDHGFILDENKHTCKRMCSGILLKEKEGIIQSSRYPKPYSKLAECDWTIDGGEKFVAFRFVGDFAIEEHETLGCVYDWLQYETFSGEVSSRICGSQKPNNGAWITTGSHRVKFTFHSDLSVEELGFQIRYMIHSASHQFETEDIGCKEPLKILDGVGLIYDAPSIPAKIGTVISFSCGLGYTLIGNHTITCNKNGEWSAAAPNCVESKNQADALKIQCQFPSHLSNIKNGRIAESQTTQKFKIGSRVTVRCNQWYILKSGSSEWECGNDGYWHEGKQSFVVNSNQNVPECEPICGLKGTTDILSGDYTEVEEMSSRPDDDYLLGPQVIGGKDAKQGEWPWMALITRRGAGIDSSNICGGTLISEKAVVSAAHCFPSELKREWLSVYLGVHDRGVNLNQTSSIQVFSISEILTVGEFSNTDYKDDIVIIILNKPAKIGKYVRPICLPRTPKEINLPRTYQKPGVVTGWGLTNATDRHGSLILKEAKLPYIDHEKCVEAFEKNKPASHSDIKISDTMICAGFIDGGSDSCYGDSGGPLAFRHPDINQWFLTGIVSFGSTSYCGEKTFGIYTSTAKYMHWIDTNLS